MTHIPDAPASLERDERNAQRKARKLRLQRERRQRFVRIDYYASADAAALIDALTTPGVGGDRSSVINRLLTRHRNFLLP
jgi:hypothetical protein